MPRTILRSTRRGLRTLPGGSARGARGRTESASMINSGAAADEMSSTALGLLGRHQPWAASSAGRAPRSQRGGREFEPRAVHHLKAHSISKLQASGDRTWAQPLSFGGALGVQRRKRRQQSTCLDDVRTGSVSEPGQIVPTILPSETEVAYVGRASRLVMSRMVSRSRTANSSSIIARSAQSTRVERLMRC
jgi:hypothetical protein